MTDKEVLLGLIGDLQIGLRKAMGDISPEATHWKSDPGANTIATTAWHIGRLLDDLWARVVEERPAEEQVWAAGGWLAQTGYDPQGVGDNGWGTLMGFSQRDVDDLPVLSAAQLLDYVAQVCVPLSEAILGVDEETFHQITPGWIRDEWTTYGCITHYLMDAFQHLGEIRAAKAMWERVTAQ